LRGKRRGPAGRGIHDAYLGREEMKGSYVVIADWMLDLGLKSKELMVYALVHGVCSHNQSYYGTLEHTAQWARCCKDTAGDVLASLVEKGLLVKRERYDGARKLCFYTLPAGGGGGEGPPEAPPGGGEAAPEGGGDAPAGRGQSTDSHRQNTDGHRQNTDGHRQNTDGAIGETPMYRSSNNINIQPKKTNGFSEDNFAPAGKNKQAEGGEDITALFNRARELWNGSGIKPECRDLIIPPSEYGCMRAFQNYRWDEIENAIRNYDWHVKGRCGEGFRPPPPYGSIYGFLKSGVSRYYDDEAIDQQFREKRRGA
jgi:hypothetical protein